ncbi:transposon Ty3-I Gag-Pol polyprotein [Trichonephila clavipes]|nr:transposon Ty3-I Gag-Pol polyprotein [Trichonephila clavipes]
MKIILKDEEPVCPTSRLIDFQRKTRSKNKQIEEWLNEGIIRPSSSNMQSPIVMVKERWIFEECALTRKLNQKLVKDKFPLSLSSENVLDTLQEQRPNLAPLQVWKKSAELHTDACKQGYGAILLPEAEDGKLHPVTTCRRRQIQQKKKDNTLKIATDCSAFQEGYAKGANYSFFA